MGSCKSPNPNYHPQNRMKADRTLRLASCFSNRPLKIFIKIKRCLFPMEFCVDCWTTHRGLELQILLWYYIQKYCDILRAVPGSHSIVLKVVRTVSESRMSVQNVLQLFSSSSHQSKKLLLWRDKVQWTDSGGLKAPYWRRKEERACESNG